jgi:hypothetical protein
MSSAAELQLLYKTANAPILPFPFPHFFVQDVFPADFYESLQQNLPDPAALIPIEQARPVRGYKERFVLELRGQFLNRIPEDKRRFWQDFGNWLVDGKFRQIMLAKFGQHVQHRFQSAPNVEFEDEAMLVEDITNYALGPHTDSPRKVITFLFYLPKDRSQIHLGTSIYVPRDPQFRCQGGPHYPKEHFERITTMPFTPNSLFCFFKTDNSFHGVEPVSDPDCRRWLLLFDIYLKGGAGPAPMTQWRARVSS